jgi:hypothetical protein
MSCMSSLIQVSKSSALRPLSAQRQVSPGRMRNRRRCQRFCMSWTVRGANAWEARRAA